MSAADGAGIVPYACPAVGTSDSSRPATGHHRLRPGTARYTRHYAYELKLDRITTATGRSDAAFRVTS